MKVKNMMKQSNSR